jgi:hypothetical protein
VLSSAQVSAFDTAQIQALESADIRSLSLNALKGLDTGDIVALTTEQVASLTTAQVASLSSAQVAAIESADITALSSSQVVALSTANLAILSTSQAAALEAGDLAAMGSASIRALSVEAIHALSTSAVEALNSTQVRSLTTAQIQELSTEQFVTLSSADVGAFTTSQIAALTTDQIAAFHTDQIAGLTTAEIRAMTMVQVSAFSGEAISVMTTAQQNAKTAVSPIVLDLNGDGVSTLDASNGARFDLNATGSVDQVGWVGSGDGLLVLDRNTDGFINDGRELFGTATLLANGKNASNGFAALGDLDSNQDGQISAADLDFSKLQVWIDGNHDGITGAGELRTLADLGIVSMDLQAQAGTEMDHGNLLGLTSSYTTTDGQSHDMADVWFAKEVPADGTPVELTITDVLIDPGHSDALAAVSGSNDPATVKQDAASAPVSAEGTPVAPVAPVEHVADQTVVVDPTKGLIIDQNNNPLI